MKYADVDVVPGARVEFWSDSDWAADKNDRKSYTGYMGYLFGMPITWQTRKQVTVALSSCEAEYYALTDTLKEALHVTHILGEIMPIERPVLIHCDNQGASYLANDSINNKRNKHIDIRYRFITYYLKTNQYKLNYVPSNLNVADMFTKALSGTTFSRLLKFIFP